jgi:hypothetical protein
MDSRHGGSALVFASAVVLCTLLPSAVSAPGAPETDQKPKVIGITVGATTPVPDRPGDYERVLVAPPDEASMSRDAVWEIGPDLAVRLGRLSKEERWAAIRRNLELAPEGTEPGDVILWREVVDTVFDMVGTLHTTAEGGPPAFGLKVAFPSSGEDPSNPPPQAALTLNKTAKRDLDQELTQAVTAEITGVEGFLEPAPASPDQIEVCLLSASGERLVAHPDPYGYFCFPHLSVDPDLGADYQVAVWYSLGGGSATAGWREGKARYVPVKNGARTVVHLTFEPPVRIMGIEPSIKGLTGNWLDLTQYSGMIEEFVGQIPLLGSIVQRLTPNPGLHVGAVAVRGSGLQPIWSTRYLLKQPTLNRGPQLVSQGTMRLECLTPAPSEEEGPSPFHYVKVVLVGHATSADLDLQSRPTIVTPWGIGIGVVPSADPALYTLGASYELTPGAQFLAGVGLQRDHSNSLVYGVTVDLDRILNGVFGKVTGGGR